MLKKDIGANAGIIWTLLHQNGALSIREIDEYTGFRKTFILYSLGWLARENKIRFFEKDDSIHVELISNHSEMYF